jgi:hypothetical protein
MTSCLAGIPRAAEAALGIFCFLGERKRRVHHRGHGEHREEREQNRKKKFGDVGS